MGGVEFRLLGPVGVWRDGSQLAPANAQQRTILAVLLLTPGTVVGLDQFVTALWGEDPPASARNAVQGHVSRLRRLLRDLPGAALHTVGAGYRLDVAPAAVDLHRFRALTAAGDRPALRTALALWRGPAFADVAGDWLAATTAPGLDEERAAAVDALALADLRAGSHAEAAALLSAAVARHPLRESSVALLMTAMHRAGRRGEALEAFRQCRLRLARDLGIEPGDDLQRLHREILAGSPAPPARPAASDPPGWPAPAVPRQLPAEVPDFTGRGAELAALDALLAPVPATAADAAGTAGAGDGSVAAWTTATSPADGLALRVDATGSASDGSAGGGAGRRVAVVVAGAAGVGKTALAVRWAHRVAERFPDGQLFLDLRGFDPDATAMPAAEGIPRLLAALGVPGRQLPHGLDAQGDLFRTLLADRRVLIVLDNARDAAQVRPFLPGAPGCLVVVTSRDRLTGLVAGDGAVPLLLDRPSEAEAREFLTRRLGTARIGDEPDAGRQIVDSCGRLPLALAVVAARAATSHLPLAALAAELRESRGRLDALDAGDPATDVRTVFSWSYRALGTDAARLFRLLGLHVGPDVSLTAAASLAGLDAGRARALAGELTRLHLIDEHVPGRYAFHDLLRAYARELVLATEPAADRRLALHRLLDHYLHGARHAGALVEPSRAPIPVEPCVPGVHPDEPAGPRAALDWFTAERHTVLAAVERAADEGFPGHAWRLAWTIKPWLSRQWHREEQVRAQRTAVTAADRDGDRTAQAVAYRYLADGLDRLGRHAEAEENYQHALDLYVALGDRAGQAHTHLDVARMLDRQRRHHDAVTRLGLALSLFRASGDGVGEARTLAALGWEHAQLAEYGRALAHCGEAVALLRAAGDRTGEGACWDSIGYIHHRRGDFRSAITCFERALELAQQFGDRNAAAQTLVHLGESHLAAGDHLLHRDAWLRALEILDAQDPPAASALRERLRHPELVSH